MQSLGVWWCHVRTFWPGWQSAAICQQLWTFWVFVLKHHSCIRRRTREREWDMIDMAHRKPTFKSDRKTGVRHAAAMQQTSSQYFQKVAGWVHRGTSSSCLPETIVREFALSPNGKTLQGGWMAEISSQNSRRSVRESSHFELFQPVGMWPDPSVSVEKKEAEGRKLLLACKQRWPSGGCVRMARRHEEKEEQRTQGFSLLLTIVGETLVKHCSATIHGAGQVNLIQK